MAKKKSVADPSVDLFRVSLAISEFSGAAAATRVKLQQT